MKFWWFIFALLLGLCLILFGVLFSGESGELHGMAHPKHTAMAIGGPAPSRHEHLLGIGWAFGALQIVLFVSLLPLGARKQTAETDGSVRKHLTFMAFAFVGACLVYLAIFSAVMLLYRSEIHSLEPAFVFSFPRSTLVMLLVLWSWPVVFVLVYVAAFHRIIVSNDRRED